MEVDMRDEILLILGEECAEVIQAITKCERFGIDNFKPGKSKTNREHLETELGDVLAMIDLLVDYGTVNLPKIMEAKVAKRQKLKEWSSIDPLLLDNK